MKYITKSQHVKINWTVTRMCCLTKENLTGCHVVMLLRNDTLADKSVMHTSIDGGIAKGVSHEALKPGVYGAELIWQKKSQNSTKTMRCSVDNLFAVTEDTERAQPTRKDFEIALKTKSETYGMDGMSAYESAVLRGLTALDESEWVSNIAEANDRLDYQRKQIEEITAKLAEHESRIRHLETGEPVKWYYYSEWETDYIQQVRVNYVNAKGGVVEASVNAHQVRFEFTTTERDEEGVEFFAEPQPTSQFIGIEPEYMNVPEWVTIEDGVIKASENSDTDNRTATMEAVYDECTCDVVVAQYGWPVENVTYNLPLNEAMIVERGGYVWNTEWEDSAGGIHVGITGKDDGHLTFKNLSLLYAGKTPVGDTITWSIRYGANDHTTFNFEGNLMEYNVEDAYATIETHRGFPKPGYPDGDTYLLSIDQTKGYAGENLVVKAVSITIPVKMKL